MPSSPSAVSPSRTNGTVGTSATARKTARAPRAILLGSPPPKHFLSKSAPAPLERRPRFPPPSPWNSVAVSLAFTGVFSLGHCGFWGTKPQLDTVIPTKNVTPSQNGPKNFPTFRQIARVVPLAQRLLRFILRATPRLAKSPGSFSTLPLGRLLGRLSDREWGWPGLALCGLRWPGPPPPARRAAFG